MSTDLFDQSDEMGYSNALSTYAKNIGAPDLSGFNKKSDEVKSYNDKINTVLSTVGDGFIQKGLTDTVSGVARNVKTGINTLRGIKPSPNAANTPKDPSAGGPADAPPTAPPAAPEPTPPANPNPAYDPDSTADLPKGPPASDAGGAAPGDAQSAADLAEKEAAKEAAKQAEKEGVEQVAEKGATEGGEIIAAGGGPEDPLTDLVALGLGIGSLFAAKKLQKKAPTAPTPAPVQGISVTSTKGI
tara:strand:- start:1162 stop:1893 length:732 start_codon:yes stop_codon:yes gene_type:complete